MFIFMGDKGAKTIISPRCIEAVEQIPGGKKVDSGVRVFLSGGHEVEIYGVEIEHFWEEIKIHFNQIAN
jgi:hypothetical protein